MWYAIDVMSRLEIKRYYYGKIISSTYLQSAGDDTNCIIKPNVNYESFILFPFSFSPELGTALQQRDIALLTLG